MQHSREARRASLRVAPGVLRAATSRVPSMDETSLEIRVDRARVGEGVLVVVLAGEVDPSTAGRLRVDLTNALEADQPANVVLDLAEVTFMDSSGVRVILETLHRQQALGGDVSLRNVAASPLRVLEVSGLTGLIRSE